MATRDTTDATESKIVFTVVKWIAVVVTPLSAIIGAVWVVASVKAGFQEQINMLNRNQTILQESFREFKTQTEARFSRGEAKQDQTDRNVSDVMRKLDVALTLLQRIDEKVGRP